MAGMSASSSSKVKVPSRIANGKFELMKKLGAGCFGEVYRAINTETEEEVAVKVEDVGSVAPQLEHEAHMLNLLKHPVQQQGFASFFYFGREGTCNCLVMEHLGRSLEDRVQGCNGRLKVQTTVLVAEQAIRRIEYLHSRGVVHRDIKPENFMLGVGAKQHHLYLIDFGLSKRYYEKGHIGLRTKLSLTGTARYASVNAHRGIEQSRRDDLEAIAHMLFYFLRGVLPWSGLEARTKQEKYRKIKERKESTKICELCNGFPEEFGEYLRYCRGLGFRDQPDYKVCRKLFQDVRKQLERDGANPIQDWEFEWNESREMPRNLVPLLPQNDLRQPDVQQKSARARFLCCFGGGKSPSDG